MPGVSGTWQVLLWLYRTAVHRTWATRTRAPLDVPSMILDQQREQAHPESTGWSRPLRWPL